jgi:acetylornithine deacetylase/succinyl-diaminopimelate desuccinylase-like protein
MELRSRIAELMPRARDELAELVAIPSVADPRQFPPEECERAAQWVLDKFAEVGFQDAHLEKTADGSRQWSGRGPVGPVRPTVCSTRTTTCSHPSTRLHGVRRPSS